MLEEMSNIKGLDVYGPTGIFIGKVSEIVIDPDTRSVSGLFVKNPSPVIADPGVTFKIPYKWVQAIGDIVILKTFPNYVKNNGDIN